MKKALIISANHWESPFKVGSHHIAKQLVKLDWKVAFISDPISPFHIFAGITPELEKRYKSYKNKGICDLKDHVWSYVPGALFTPHNKPLLRSNFISEYWHRLTAPNIINIVKKMGFNKVDLLYFDNANQSFWLDHIDYAKSVYRIADRPDGFTKFTNSISLMEQKLVRKVNTVIYTASNLKPYVISLKPNDILSFPNGVDYQHFIDGNKTLPDEYTRIPKPIVIYVGAIEFWFDFDLITYTARNLPQISFVLIGPDLMAKSKIEPLQNIHILGARAYDKLPGYLHNANVGIIPFNVKGHPTLINSVNPLKLYEYMACGLPVVSIKWQELDNLKSPACLCDDKEEFVSAIEQACYNPENQEVYTNYAFKHDWSIKVKELLDYLGLV